MRTRPILFNGEMVRAILDGRKTQTRRVIREQPPLIPMDDRAIATLIPQCPYQGDRLWGEDSFDDRTRWSPSIFMPRWASRLLLDVLGIRVERVQDIDEYDAVSEGVSIGEGQNSTIDTFRELWDSINAQRGFGWDKNPWVWVVDFKRVV